MPVRPKDQREVDIKAIPQMIRKGYTREMIALKLGVSTTIVSLEMRKIREQVEFERVIDPKFRTEEDIKDRLDQLAEIKIEAWEAWEKSKKESYSRTETREPDRTCAVCSGSGAVKERVCGYCKGQGAIKGKVTISETRNTRGPDARYLALVITCIAQERELLGLDAPKRIQAKVTGDTGSALSWGALLASMPTDPKEIDVIEERIKKELEYRPSTESTNGNGHTESK